MSLKTYLKRHFVDRAAYASLAEISSERLDQLIAAGAVPSPTYVGNGNSIRSEAFGQIETAEAVSGEYFRPECARWVKIAHQAPSGSEKTTVLDVLVAELRAALKAHPDIQIDGDAEIESRIQEYIPSFFDGTFGLCVADPSSGAGIVRKEILQEKLTALTDNGKNAAPQGIQQSDLLQLIDEYSNSAMPFSPAEYVRSSRKRLVDDLRRVVMANAMV